MKPLFLSLLTGAFIALFAQSAVAAQATTGMQPTATIPGSCVVVAPQALAFGAYDATGANFTAPRDMDATFVVRCNKGSLGGANLKISMGPGLNHNGAGCLNKRMSNGAGSFLNYEIHTVSGRFAKWGCMTLGENGMMGNTYDTGADNTLTMHGRIPAGQSTPQAGAYSDTIDIILSF